MTPSFMTSAPDRYQRSASRPGRSTPGEIAPSTHWIQGWVSPRAGLNAVGKIKILPCREKNQDHPASSPSLYRLSYPDSSSGALVDSENLLFYNSRIMPMACSGFCDFHFLRGLPGSYLPSGLRQIACFGTRPSSILFTH
jgi:hypothetical protein